MASNVLFESSLNYERAGVGLNFSLKTSPVEDQTAFKLTIDDLKTG
ncbi:MAG: hypothetical protein QF659_03075 [Dehalococcoidia bacterium]|jgi:hypothetical protein|nr:hypothetical protein [Dehalococcoidia bacterium]